MTPLTDQTLHQFLLRQERSPRSKYWQHVCKIYNLDVTRRFDVSHLPPIYVHIIYERQLLQGLTLAIVNYTPASRCIYIFRRLCRDLSATKSVAARFLCMLKNLAATDLVAARSPTSRRLLCNLAGTDRGPCCDLCDRWKLSVAERSQSGCSVCLTGVLITKKSFSLL